MSQMEKRSSQHTEPLSRTIRIPDAFSLLNAFSGLCSIFFSLRQSLSLAAAFLLIAAVFDVLDGKIAKILRTQREFGRQMDALADIISFGVAPVILGLQILPHTSLNIGILTLFVLCGIVRLARFNALGDLPYYVGLTITASSSIIAILFLAGFAYFTYAYLILALLMISPFKIKKFL